MLFSDIIFGPVKSRRLGVSLGINLLPVKSKICSFNCIYCECGLNGDYTSHEKLPSRQEVYGSLEKKLAEMKEKGEAPDVLTFAGNGEPTIHPDFERIINDTVVLRDKYFPEAKISVLSNATMIHKESVFRALSKVDNNILKLDSVLNEKVCLIDQPNNPEFSVEKLVEYLKKFNGNLIIQTMFIKGKYNGIEIDNTRPEEVEAWVRTLKEIHPRQVMIYTIERQTPFRELEKVPVEELNKIARQLEKEGFNVSVSG